MQLSISDILVIAGYFLLSLAIGIWFSRKAGKNAESFFLGGRNMPWWLAGISMVATTFAADTPLAVTELVAADGIAGNWIWWNMLIGGMLTVFFFAKQWRKANVLTDLEFIELRYSGPAARILRGFRAVYLGLFMNALIIGWVNLALMSLLEVFFDLSYWHSFLVCMICMAAVSIYTSMSGLMGVAATDVLQFVLAMCGTVVLSYLVVDSPDIGGLSGLVDKLPERSLRFFPEIGDTGSGETMALGWGSLLAFAGVQWWASWYPGAEPGGGGYVAQRMMSAKNERHAFWATFLFQAAHYCLRPWPWIITALCAVVLYPDLSDPKLGYVMVMKDYLPDGLRGLLLAAFLAAYMSTISTQLNWGTGYLINDLLKRFNKNLKTDKQVVMASRVVTVLVMVFAGLVTSQIDSIKEVWKFIIECGAGLGMVLILRWYWWRVNAQAEIAATVAPFFFFGLLKVLAMMYGDSVVQFTEFPGSFFITVGGTTLTWIVVMYAFPPEKDSTLEHFVERVEPKGIWSKFARSQGQGTPLWVLTIAWLLSIAGLYSLLFATGKFLLQQAPTGYLYLGTSLIAIGGLALLMRKYKVF